MTSEIQPKISAQELYDQLIAEKLNYLNAQREIDNLTQKNSTLETENQHLKNENALLRQQLYGTKSEKAKLAKSAEESSGDACVFDEASITDVVLEENNEAEIAVSVAGEASSTASDNALVKKSKGARKPLPEHYPRVRIEHDLDESLKICKCGCGLSKIGEEISERLDVIPAQVRVLQHVRFKYACKACTDGVTTAPMPAQVIPKGIPSPGLLSHVCISKFDDHLPLYRQSEIWARLGVEIPRSTLSSWVIQVGKLVEPLVELLRQTICATDYAHADETQTQVLKEKGRTPTSTSYMWLYMTGSYAVGEITPKPISVVYDYQETRKKEHATKFLKGFQGYLQTDAYSGYDEITSQDVVTSVGCWAHARRKFSDVYKMGKKQPGKAEDAIKIIGKLYEYEKMFQEGGLSAQQRQKLRKEQVMPLLERFKSWLMVLRPKVPPKNPLGKAISYTLNQWESLIVYTQDGRLNIDNNPAERMIRPFTVGRKNWLFMGSPDGAKASAAIYSLIETAKANCVHPGEYLTYIFTELPLTSAEKLHTLLPWNVQIAASC
jgi:transposase/regulator of replication initiation timing